ncbi:MAG TPA: TolC family protein [Thermoanaerobaculaceae bacterium]|nr:TolC family protein [Thermoanaerobaculaceae bacterium]
MNQRANRLTCLIALVVAAGGAVTRGAVAPSKAAPEAAPQPPVYAKGEISLMDAVRLTLEHDPNIKLQQAATQLQAGVAQQATGQFDTALTGQFSLSLSQTELTSQQKNSEQKTRTDLQTRANAAGSDAALQDQVIGQITQAETVFGGGGDPNSVHFDDPFTQAYFNLLYKMYSTAAPAVQQGLGQSIVQWLEANKQAAQSTKAQDLSQQQDLLGQLADLGAMPKVNQDYNGSLNLQLSKQYRNGITLAPFLDLAGTGTGYRGKPNSSDFGGKGITDSYTSQLGFSVTIPLGRNAGTEATGASERAAQIDYEASVSALTHAASNSVFNTIVAYWNLVAAQERLKVLEENLTLQGKLLETTQALIQADELARAELARSQASEANARAQVEDAKRSVHEARVTLARTIGLQINDDTNAPLADGTFPEPPADAALQGLQLDALEQLALEHRYDLKAAMQSQSSGRVLWRAAVLNLRRQIDLQMQFSYQGLGESNGIVDGLRDSLGSWAGPSGQIGLNVTWPFANNVQKGLLEQESALYAQSQISARDLERLVRANVVLVAGSLKEAVEQFRRYSDSVGFYRQTVDAEMEKLRLGNATLIDTLLTQQQLTSANLALVSARQLYSQFLAQLRFETGSLIKEQQAGKFISEPDLVSLPAPSRPAAH